MKAIKRMSRTLGLKEGNSISTEQKSPKSQSFQSTKPKQQNHDFLSMAIEKCPYPLTIDCLEEIFSHLIDDKLTLFSCILVNSLWLNLCIPLLWNKPFDDITFEKSKFLIGTYISCLSTRDKQKLLQFYSNYKGINKYSINNNNKNKNNEKNNKKNRSKRKKYPIIAIQTKLFSKSDYHQKNSLTFLQVSLKHEPLFIY